MTTLSIVIPAYNEERGIADIILRVLGVKADLAKTGVGLENCWSLMMPHVTGQPRSLRI